MTAKILRDKFEADLLDLQNICPHLEVEALPYMYAAGHFDGTVEICSQCEKIMGRQHDHLGSTSTD